MMERQLARQEVMRARSRALPREGRRMAIRRAMIATTTSSSMRVKAPDSMRRDDGRERLTFKVMGFPPDFFTTSAGYGKMGTQARTTPGGLIRRSLAEI